MSPRARKLPFLGSEDEFFYHTGYLGRCGFLILFSRFADDPRSGLVNVLALAFVRVELLLNSGLCFRRPTERLMCRELHITELADPQHWNVIRAPNDPKFSLWHG